MRCLVTGGAGTIGSELVRQLSEKHQVFILDIDETRTFNLFQELRDKNVYYRVGDIRNPETLADVFSDFKPEVVYHAGAYKHVTPMEVYPEEAIQTNVVGTLNILKESKRREVKKFVYISTDKAVNSNCIMGATKRLGEIMTKNHGYTAVRFANVLGSRGSVIPIWQEQIEQGRPLTITDPRMTRYMMTIEEAVSLVIEAGNKSKGGELFILDMGEPINILDLAKEIIAKSGKNIDIEEIGIRPGETLSEELMFEEEKKVAKKEGNFYII